MTKYTTVSIPSPLADNIKKQIKDTGFTSVSDYVTFVLREVLVQVKDNAAVGKSSEGQVRSKLKALGYL